DPARGADTVVDRTYVRARRTDCKVGLGGVRWGAMGAWATSGGTPGGDLPGRHLAPRRVRTATGREEPADHPGTASRPLRRGRVPVARDRALPRGVHARGVGRLHRG